MTAVNDNLETDIFFIHAVSNFTSEKNAAGKKRRHLLTT